MRSGAGGVSVSDRSPMSPRLGQVFGEGVLVVLSREETVDCLVDVGGDRRGDLSGSAAREETLSRMRGGGVVVAGDKQPGESAPAG